MITAARNSTPNAEATAEPAQAQAQTPAPEPAVDEIDRMIGEAAYYIAQRRGFEPGHEVDDWLQAEAQVFDALAQGKS